MWFQVLSLFLAYVCITKLSLTLSYREHPRITSAMASMPEEDLTVGTVFNSVVLDLDGKILRSLPGIHNAI
jgi:hypothetical protein